MTVADLTIRKRAILTPSTELGELLIQDLDLKQVLAYLREETNSEDKNNLMIQLGDDHANSEPLAMEEKMTSNLVAFGAKTWIVFNLKDHKIQIRAVSDSMLINGLLHIIFSCYQNRHPKKIIAFDFVAYTTDLKLSTFCSMQKLNHLHKISDRIKEFAKNLPKKRK